MHRRVLIAEQADTVRAVAEAVLRQNGYDVIAVTAAEKAREVLELSKPDLLIIGADLAAPDGTPYYERLRKDSRTAQIPTLLIEPPDKTPITISDLTVVPRPLDPQDFLQKVTLALAGGGVVSPNGPLASADIDDDFLDAALGLGNIDVTSSEVMDKTGLGLHIPGSATGEKPIGMEAHQEKKTGESGGNKVEAIVLDMKSSRVTSRTPGRKAPVEGTGKLEILTDQYGLEKPLPAVENEHANHDYDWFIDAIKEDNTPTTPGKGSLHETGGLVISERSALVDPSTPGPTPSYQAVPPPPGVEKFIDEFKKEMQQLREVDSDTAIPEVKTIKGAGAGEKLDWEEKLEQIGPTEMEMFTREFARELGHRVAEIIAAKIDPDKLMRLIRAEVVERYQKKK
jgi:DNA-binding response OmpR family regulator